MSDTLVIEWNGTELPEALRSLPPGRYLIEPVDDEPVLTPEEDAGLREAMDDLDAGHGVSLQDALTHARRALHRT